MLAFEFAMTPWFSVLASLWSLSLISLTLTFGGDSPQGKPLEQTLAYSPLRGESFSSHMGRNRHRMEWRRCEVARWHSVFDLSTLVIRVSLVPKYRWPRHGRRNIDYCWFVDPEIVLVPSSLSPASFHLGQELLTKLLAGKAPVARDWV